MVTRYLKFTRKSQNNPKKVENKNCLIPHISNKYKVDGDIIKTKIEK